MPAKRVGPHHRGHHLAVDGQRHVDAGPLHHGRPVLVAQRVPELDAVRTSTAGSASATPLRSTTMTSPSAMRATIAVARRLVPVQDVAVVQLRAAVERERHLGAAVGQLAQPVLLRLPLVERRGRRPSRRSPAAPSTVDRRCCRGRPRSGIVARVTAPSAEEVELVERDRLGRRRRWRARRRPSPRRSRGSTSMCGVPPLRTMSRLVSVRVPNTGMTWRRRSEPLGDPGVVAGAGHERDAGLRRGPRRTRRTSAGRSPAAGSAATRSGRPCSAQMIRPPLMTIFGLAPKNAGSHSTRSAILPGSIEPRTCEMPWVIAGLIVTLATYRSTRKLSLPGASSGSAPRAAFIASAVWIARSQFSPTRPIACESLEIIEITPMSCSTFSAAIVSARTRLSANDDVRRDLRVEVVADHDHVEQLGLRVDAVRQRRVGRARQHVELAGHLQDVRRVAAAGALGVEGVDRAALERGDRVLDEAGSR